MRPVAIAHLSDIHLPPPPPRLGDLTAKRALSWLSWRLRRSKVHQPDALARVMTDVIAHDPDHLVITGDLTNMALPEEFAGARDWLIRSGAPDRLTVVPGNHDALAPVAWARSLALWAPWMGSDGAPPSPAPFPFVRVRERVALVGVSSAVTTPLGQASGRIGSAQLEALHELLADLGARGLFRLVLLHHPVDCGPAAERKALSDRADLGRVLGAVGAELVLHGHAHREQAGTIGGPAGPIPVLGAPSASAAPHHGPEAGGWRYLRIEHAGPDAWQVRSLGRRLTPAGVETVSDTTIKIRQRSQA